VPGVRRLVVFGDSYVEGQRKDPHLMITKYNPCYYLAKELGCEVENKGKFGSCNQAIANEVFRFCMNRNTDNVAFLVVWSDVRRCSTLNARMDKQKEMSFDDWQYVSSMSDRDFDARKSIGLDDYRNPAMHRMSFEHAMHSVRMICQDYDIPLLMTNSIDTVPHQSKTFFKGRDRPIRYCMGRANGQWIEGDKPNNSLFDLITGRWLREDISDLTFVVKHSMIRNAYTKDKSKFPYLTKCFHPWDEGNELIAKTLAPYIKPILEK
jgi:hypothetical protein